MALQGAGMSSGAAPDGVPEVRSKPLLPLRIANLIVLGVRQRHRPLGGMKQPDSLTPRWKSQGSRIMSRFYLTSSNA